jgi:hypothetical protein
MIGELFIVIIVPFCVFVLRHCTKLRNPCINVRTPVFELQIDQITSRLEVNPDNESTLHLIELFITQHNSDERDTPDHHPQDLKLV